MTGFSESPSFEASSSLSTTVASTFYPSGCSGDERQDRSGGGGDGQFQPPITIIEEAEEKEKKKKRVDPDPLTDADRKSKKKKNKSKKPKKKKIGDANANIPEDPPPRTAEPSGPRESHFLPQSSSPNPRHGNFSGEQSVGPTGDCSVISDITFDMPDDPRRAGQRKLPSQIDLFETIAEEEPTRHQDGSKRSFDPWNQLGFANAASNFPATPDRDWDVASPLQPDKTELERYPSAANFSPLGVSTRSAVNTLGEETQSPPFPKFHASDLASLDRAKATVRPSKAKATPNDASIFPQQQQQKQQQQQQQQHLRQQHIRQQHIRQQQQQHLRQQQGIAGLESGQEQQVWNLLAGEQMMMAAQSPSGANALVPQEVDGSSLEAGEIAHGAGASRKSERSYASRDSAFSRRSSSPQSSTASGGRKMPPTDDQYRITSSSDPPLVDYAEGFGDDHRNVQFESNGGGTANSVKLLQSAGKSGLSIGQDARSLDLLIMYLKAMGTEANAATEIAMSFIRQQRQHELQVRSHEGSPETERPVTNNTSQEPEEEVLHSAKAALMAAPQRSASDARSGTSAEGSVRDAPVGQDAATSTHSATVAAVPPLVGTTVHPRDPLHRQVPRNGSIRHSGAASVDQSVAQSEAQTGSSVGYTTSVDSNAPVVPPRMSTRNRVRSERSTASQPYPGTARRLGTRMFWQRASRPGAVRVYGRAFGAPNRRESLRDIESTLSAGVESEPHIIEATAVKDSDSDELPVVYADSSPLSIKHFLQERSVRRLLILVVAVVVLVSICIGLFAAVGSPFKSEDDLEDEMTSPSILPSPSPSAMPSVMPTFISEEMLEQAILLSGEEALSKENSPQRSAVGWLSRSDNRDTSGYGSAFRERYALAVIFYSTGARDELTELGWMDATAHVCNWTQKVSCNEDRNVKALDLLSHNLTGSFPVEIELLPSLEFLRFAGNVLTGPLPEQVLKLPNLKVFFANDNQMSGEIPRVVGSGKLVVMDLSRNNFSSTIPDSIYNYTKLKTLEMSYNHFSGTISSKLGGLRLLNKLNLASNKLSGQIPDLGGLSRISFIDLGHNQLTGSFPDWIFQNLTALKELTISHNQLGGALPSMDSVDIDLVLADYSIKLTTVDFSHNSFTGEYPSWTALIPSIQYLDISHNSFDGTFPFAGGSSTRQPWAGLVSLNVAGNHFNGTISVSALPQGLHHVNFSTNLVNWQSSPSDFCGHPVLESISLAGNAVEGSSVTFLSCASNFRSIDLSGCGLVGAIPGKGLPDLESLRLANNELSSTIPKELSLSTSLQELVLSSNRLSGGIPNELSALSQMRHFHVDNNNLSGVIPREIEAWSDLQSFKVVGNNFGWNIPEGICDTLGTIRLEDVGCLLECSCCTDDVFCGEP